VIEALRGLKKRILVVQDFGAESLIGKRMINSLYKPARTQTLFEDWKRVLQQVSAFTPSKAEGLERVYEITEDPDHEKLFFSLHTYFAFIMKVIAAEIVVLYGGGKFTQSYIDSL
jgi:hypothetical protein